MVLTTLPFDQPIKTDLQLVQTAVAVPALASNVRPALVLAERQARELLTAALGHDVGNGGRFCAGPAGIQLWSGPFDGQGGTRGSAVLLGSVNWTYDTPVRHYATIYRAMVTSTGLEGGHTPPSVLAEVLALTGLSVEGARLTMAVPPARDPFHSMRA